MKTKTPTIVSQKAQMYKNNKGQECINILLRMKELEQIVTKDGFVPITVLPRTQNDNKEKYGTHWAKPCIVFNIMKGHKIVDKLAVAAGLEKDTIPMMVINDEIERKQAEAGRSDLELEYKYNRNV